MRLEKRKNHTIEAVVDRIILKPLPQPPIRVPHISTLRRRFPPKSSTIPAASKPPSPKPCRWPTASSSSASKPPTQGRDPLLLLHGLPRLRHQRPPPRAPQLLLQLQLRRLPRVPRPRQHLRLRPRQDHHRLVQAPARRSHGPRLRLAYLLRLIKLAAEKYKINLKQPFSELTNQRRPPEGRRYKFKCNFYTGNFRVSIFPFPLSALNLVEVKNEKLQH